MNIVDPILFQCRHHPSTVAICCPGTQLNLISYGRLEQFINNVGRRALAMGIARGQIVAILTGDKILHAALVLGLTRLGIITLSARDERLPKELNVDVALVDAASTIQNTKRVIIADLSWTMGDGKPPADAAAHRTDPDDICRIGLTSGTTGEAKGVAFSHKMLIDRMQHYDVAKGPGHPFYARVYCDLGISTDMGIRYLLYMLFKGGTIFFYGADPMTTLQTFDLYKVQAMIASPYGLGEYLKFYESRPAFTCSFEHISAAGGIVSKRFSERVRARMTNNLVCCYGSTEAGSVACAPAQIIADVPMAVGHVAPWIDVEIVDESDRALPCGNEGIVRIRGPYNVSGYVNDPQETAKAFRDGWFYPGDIGSLSQDRLLAIIGRVNAVLNIGGDKVNPEVIENLLAGVEGIEHAAAFTAPDELGNGVLHAAIVGRPGRSEEDLRRYCERELGKIYAPAHIRSVEQIPRNEAGKIDRLRLAQQLARAERA